MELEAKSKHQALHPHSPHDIRDLILQNVGNFDQLKVKKQFAPSMKPQKKFIQKISVQDKSMIYKQKQYYSTLQHNKMEC